MKNILLIIKREYLSRVKKKSFIVMTILGPLLIGLLYAGMIFMMLSDNDLKKIEVLDSSKLFIDKFENTSELQFNYTDRTLDSAKKSFSEDGYNLLVYIPENVINDGKGVKVYSNNSIALELESQIRNTIEKEIERIKLGDLGINKETLDKAKLNVSLETINIKDGKEKESNSALASGVGLFMAFLIYLSVLIYGSQVMRGVTEEKTSRIVEVIISSVKPFELMLGKVIGVALVGLTQFLLWIVLSGVVLGIGGAIMGDKIIKNQDKLIEARTQNLPAEQQEALQKEINSMESSPVFEVQKAMNSLPLLKIGISFFFYFIAGYLLYSSLFAAVGAAVDSEADTGQFMLPLTMPIIAGIFIAQTVVFKDPNSSLAVWGSMIPLTSPIVMMARMPFDVPVWEIIVSLVFLFLGFAFTVWIGARIYRVGILMYGKKTSYKELAKWIFYKG